MKILVPIKRVPDTDQKIQVKPDGSGIVTDGLPFVVNPFDAIAVEEALRIRENSAEAAEVLAVSIGTEACEPQLRTALAMGADGAVHVIASPAGLDAVAVSEALASAIRGLPYDIVLCGKQATDEDDAAVGPMLAARLGIPCVAFVTAIEPAGRTATVRREIDGEVEVLEVTLPALFTAQKGLADARLPGLKGIMAAKKKPLAEKPLSGAASPTEVRSLSTPTARAACVKVPATADGIKTLLNALRSERGVL